jgi:hypothetical protein
VGRDSEFVVLPGSEDEHEAYEALARRLRTRATPDDDWCGWGEIVRLSDVLREDVPRWLAIDAERVWMGYGRNLIHATLRREMAALPWRDRDYVQVLMRDQDDDVFALWLLRGDVFVEAEHQGTERVPTAWEMWGPVLQVLPLPGPEDEPGG